jgi:hypothetical protein
MGSDLEIKSTLRWTKELRAFIRLFTRSYWTRVWVVQEMYLERRLILSCRPCNYALPLRKHFAQFPTLILWIPDERLECVGLLDLPSSNNRHTLYQVLGVLDNRQWHRHSLLLSQSTQRSMGLTASLTHSCMRHCQQSLTCGIWCLGVRTLGRIA